MGRIRVVLGPLLLCVFGGAGAALAQADSAEGDSAQRAVRTEPAPDSPRIALEEFLTRTRSGHYAEAATYLDVHDSAGPRAATLARQLKAVLDRYLWIDVETVSPLAMGDTSDGLPSRLEEIGVIRAGRGPAVPIRLTRSSIEGAPPWRFSRGTVEQTPVLYATLENRWLMEHIPDALQRPGPFELLRWQWLALPLLLVLAGVFGAIASRLLRALLWRLVRRTGTQWDDAILTRLAAPLTSAMTLATVSALIPFLDLYAPAEHAAYLVLRVGLFLVFFWSLWRLIDVVRLVIAGSRWAKSSPTSRALLPLGSRFGKVLLVMLTAVAVLSLLGFPVASLVAGLGIGGLALALAAQKTVENLFGAFSIGADQPFREGDFVKIEDFVGTVEAVGLRSSRFRTLDRTLITIPNGKLADMRLESFTARDRMRLATVIGLVYETTAAQMRDVLAGLERVLRAHPKIWPDAVVVRFREFAASSLDIEIMAWFQTRDWGEFQLIRQEILLQFMEVIEQAGTAIAFPTRTIHVLGESVAGHAAGNGAEEQKHLQQTVT